MSGRYRWVLAHDQPGAHRLRPGPVGRQAPPDDEDPEALLGAVRGASRGERRALARLERRGPAPRVGAPPGARRGELRPDVPHARRATIGSISPRRGGRWRPRPRADRCRPRPRRQRSTGSDVPTGMRIRGRSARRGARSPRSALAAARRLPARRRRAAEAGPSTSPPTTRRSRTRSRLRSRRRDPARAGTYPGDVVVPGGQARDHDPGRGPQHRRLRRRGHPRATRSRSRRTA